MKDKVHAPKGQEKSKQLVRQNPDQPTEQQFMIVEQEEWRLKGKELRAEGWKPVEEEGEEPETESAE